MKSKVEILNKDQNIIYQWKRYGVTEKQKYIWDKYECDYNSTHVWSHFYTKALQENVDIYANWTDESYDHRNLTFCNYLYIGPERNHEKNIIPINISCDYDLYIVVGPNNQLSAPIHYTNADYKDVYKKAITLYTSSENRDVVYFVNDWNYDLNNKAKIMNKMVYWNDYEESDYIYYYDLSPVYPNDTDGIYYLPVGSKLIANLDVHYPSDAIFSFKEYCIHEKFDTDSSWNNARLWDFTRATSSTKPYVIGTTGINSVKELQDKWNNGYKSSNRRFGLFPNGAAPIFVGIPITNALYKKYSSDKALYNAISLKLATKNKIRFNNTSNLVNLFRNNFGMEGVIDNEIRIFLKNEYVDNFENWNREENGWWDISDNIPFHDSIYAGVPLFRENESILTTAYVYDFANAPWSCKDYGYDSNGEKLYMVFIPLLIDRLGTQDNNSLSLGIKQFRFSSLSLIEPDPFQNYEAAIGYRYIGDTDYPAEIIPWVIKYITPNGVSYEGQPPTGWTFRIPGNGNYVERCYITPNTGMIKWFTVQSGTRIPIGTDGEEFWELLDYPSVSPYMNKEQSTWLKAAAEAGYIKKYIKEFWLPENLLINKNQSHYLTEGDIHILKCAEVLTAVNNRGAYPNKGLTGKIIFGNNGEYTSQGYTIGIMYSENTDPKKGKKVGQVTTSQRDYYLENVVYSGFMYEYVGGMFDRYDKDGYYTIYESTLSDEYPRNGIMEVNGSKYWFEYIGIKPTAPLQVYDEKELTNNINLIQTAGNSLLAIGTVAGASIEFTVYKNLANVLQYAGHSCIAYYKYADNNRYYTEGKFVIADIKENGMNKTTITAYDNIKKLDKVIYPLLQKLEYPLSLQHLLVYICAYCCIPYNKNLSFRNSDIMITSSFGDYKTTCREVVEWMAQLAGSIVVADTGGFLVFKDLIAPTNSRGSNEKLNYNLDVSLRPLAKPAAILFAGKDYSNLVLGTNQTERDAENRLLDYSNNIFLKDFISEDEGIRRCRELLDIFQNMGDVYAYNVKIDNDYYVMECGDSWVVATTELTPRRGIIMNKSISDSGVEFTSTGELESFIINEAVDADFIDRIIKEVDNEYSSIHVTKIVYGIEEKIVDIYFTRANTSYSDNTISFDLDTQYNGFVNGYNDLTVYVNSKECIVNITNGILTITDLEPSVSDTLIVKQIKVDSPNIHQTWELDTTGSNSFTSKQYLNQFQPDLWNGSPLQVFDLTWFNDNQLTQYYNNNQNYVEGLLKMIDGLQILISDSGYLFAEEVGSCYIEGIYDAFKDISNVSSCQISYSSTTQILTITYHE